MTDDRRIGAGLVAAGAAPLAAGALLPVTVVDGPALCPFRAMTGIPCPLCGATRAFVLAGHGDGAFADYNAVWVVVAVVAVLAGLVVLAGTTGAAAALRRRPLPVMAALLAAGWAWALAHRETIAA